MLGIELKSLRLGDEKEEKGKSMEKHIYTRNPIKSNVFYICPSMKKG